MTFVSGPSVAPLLEAEIEISAPPAAVWRTRAVFTAELQRGLGQTLRRLKAEAERSR